jgi:uncharacterized protein YukE
MDTGREFLRAQVNNALALHHTVMDELESHARQAEEAAYRDLCRKWIPRMEGHQRKLDSYAASIGADGSGGMKKALGDVLAKARNAVDAMREDDFLRIVGDTVMARQLQDTFETFAFAGSRIGDKQLADIGTTLAAEHDEMQREFNGLTREMFVDQVNGVGVAD